LPCSCFIETQVSAVGEGVSLEHASMFIYVRKARMIQIVWEEELNYRYVHSTTWRIISTQELLILFIQNSTHLFAGVET
jgi:hypothetical protein